MKKVTLSMLTFIGMITTNYAQKDSTATSEIDFEKIETMMNYQTGKIPLTAGNAFLIAR